MFEGKKIQILGGRIVEMRKRRGITQAMLAESTYMSRNTLSNIERGVTKSVTTPELQILAFALGATVDYLTGLSNEPSKLKNGMIEPIQFMPETRPDFDWNARIINALSSNINAPAWYKSKVIDFLNKAIQTVSVLISPYKTDKTDTEIERDATKSLTASELQRLADDLCYYLIGIANEPSELKGYKGIGQIQFLPEIRPDFNWNEPIIKALSSSDDVPAWYKRKVIGFLEKAIQMAWVLMSSYKTDKTDTKIERDVTKSVTTTEPQRLADELRDCLIGLANEFAPEIRPDFNWNALIINALSNNSNVPVWYKGKVIDFLNKAIQTVSVLMSSDKKDIQIVELLGDVVINSVKAKNSEITGSLLKIICTCLKSNLESEDIELLEKIAEYIRLK